jgi:hypothetical protein
MGYEATAGLEVTAGVEVVTHKTYEATLPGIGGRRRHKRFAIPANVMVIPLDGKQEPFWATAEDVSARGVFINARRHPPIDSVLMLKLVVDQHQRPLRVKAQVVHRIAELGFGCRFIDMTPTTSKALSKLVAEAAAAPPTARRTH